MFEPVLSLVESGVANFLYTAIRDGIVRQPRSGPDFEIEKQDGTRALLEVKREVRDIDQIRRMAKTVAKTMRANDRFILATIEPPRPPQKFQFNKIFASLGTSGEWVQIRDLPTVFDVPSPGDLLSPQTLSDLQVASLVKNIELYRHAPVGSAVGAVTSELKGPLADLARQFSHRTLVTLATQKGSIEERLRIAQRVEQVTVVLSDLVNFSSLVTASRPEDLKEAMERYYRLAREAVYKNGGMLDKFIGDAVVAVFGYPVATDAGASAAIRFAVELIALGKDVLSSWLTELNAVIDTGTRVGLATGDLWPINIGNTSVEISLLGDTINLAARLEKNCTPNQLLIDNRTKAKASREDSAFVDALRLTEVQIPPADAKGQQFPIRAWTTNDAV